MSLLLGIVVATYPEGNSIDVLLARDGSRLANVQVSSHAASDSTGLCNLPDIGAATGLARWDPTQPTERYVRALIDDVGGMPICTGFLLPQITQMTFQRKNFKVDRHASDVYTTINDAGDMETYHPSGSYMRFGASPAHEDLTAQDFDKNWSIKQNITAVIHWIVAVWNAGVLACSIDLDPSGSCTITAETSIVGSLDVSGNITVGNGASGTVNTIDGLTLTFQDGICTNIF